MTERERYASGTPWEPVVGYSRAVRVGNTVHVSGTTATDEAGNIVGRGDLERQARQVFANVEKALTAVGGTLGDVVRTRMYVVDISQWEIVGRVHGEVFADTRPATTMVEVSRLVVLGLKVEINAIAEMPG